MSVFGIALRRYRLEEVFGVSTDVLGASYVDRGNLDAMLRGSLRAKRHVAIHGGSLQGKSWLRRRLLTDESRIVAAQCLPDMTAATLIEEVLGILGVVADIEITAANAVEGTLEWGTSTEATAKFLKASAHARGRLTRSEREEIRQAPVGQGPASLAWAAGWIRANNRRLVFEDFHHLREPEFRRMAFIIKALGELQVHCVIVGIWPDDNLLTYYNGELTGRIDDVHLEWSGSDLRRVIDMGSSALNIEISDDLKRRLIATAYGSVGLLQHLLEDFCREAGVERTSFTRRDVADEAALDRAIARVWASTRARFAQFTQAFTVPPALGDEGETAAADVRAALLRALVDDVDDDELIDGIGRDDLLRRIRPYRAATTAEELEICLAELHQRQREMEVSPLVLAYEPNAGRLFLADRSFLFYRHDGDPEWPWRA